MENTEYKTELSSELFTYELYESGFWSALGLSYADSMNFSRLLHAVKKYGIGYCDSAKLTCRPRLDDYAVMCEMDGEKFWFHISKETYDKFLAEN